MVSMLYIRHSTVEPLWQEPTYDTTPNPSDLVFVIRERIQQMIEANEVAIE